MEDCGFENEVLGMIGNDYEAPHTIAGDLSRELGRPISEVAVRGALLSLSTKGLAQAYRFDQAAYDYLPIDSGAAANEPKAWFMATREGLRVIESTAG